MFLTSPQKLPVDGTVYYFRILPESMPYMFSCIDVFHICSSGSRGGATGILNVL